VTFATAFWFAMAGHITSLRFQKRTAERVNVYLDDEYAFAVPAVAAARLHIGQFLTDAEIAALRGEDAISKAYERAIRFLSFRPRSTTEVRRSLIEAEVDPEAVEATLTRLTEQGYLNDDEFARYWVENRQRFRPKGEQALRQELRRAGVEKETIDESLAGLDSSEAAYAAGKPRAERLSLLAETDPAAFRRKLSDFLLRRGFGYDVVKETVRRLLHEISEQ
jgi:regulatory protein